MMRGEIVTIACRYGQTERQDSHDKVEKHGFVRNKYVMLQTDSK